MELIYLSFKAPLSKEWTLFNDKIIRGNKEIMLDDVQLIKHVTEGLMQITVNNKVVNLNYAPTQKEDSIKAYQYIEDNIDRETHSSSKEGSKEKKILDRYGLDELEPKDLEAVRRIANSLAGGDLIKAGMALSFSKAEEQLKLGYLSALVEQNWIMIRQLDRLNKNMEK